MRSILLGSPYPEALVNAVMNRIRVVEKDQKGRIRDNVTYIRAAILKAWLVRNHQHQITPMLDENNPNPGYRLGRLFAALEKTQQDALPGINATIRDRFYSSASATPRAVFGRLLRTYQHHLAKLDGGRKTNREKLVQNIFWPLEGKALPAHLHSPSKACSQSATTISAGRSLPRVKMKIPRRRKLTFNSLSTHPTTIIL